MSLLDRAIESVRYSINEFIGDGEKITWEISFAGGYIKREHIKAVVTDFDGNTVEVVLGWTGDNTVTINPAVPYGHGLTIFRDTPKTEPTADFQDGAVISERNLDDNAKQAVFIAAEALDRGEGALAELAPRAILVPVGEIAPAFPPRERMKGKLVGVDLNGKFIPVGFDSRNVIIDASMVSFDGTSLRDKLKQTIDDLALTTQELEQQAFAITDAGEKLALQSTSTANLQTALTGLRNDHESLVGLVDALEGLEGIEGLATIIRQEQSERITADTAMAARVALIGATNGDGTAFIINIDNVKVSPTETLAQRLDFLDAEDGEAAALIEQERSARVAGDTAEATARLSLGTTLGNQIGAAVLSESKARSSALEAEATARTQLAATLRNEQSTAITAAINSEASTRATAIGAEATTRGQLAATLRTETDQKVSAAIKNEQTARATAIGAEATSRQQLGVTLNSNISAQVQAEANARVAADGAIASTVALIGAIAPNGTAFQLDTSRVIVDGGKSFAQRLSGLDVAIGAVSSTVADEHTAWSTATNSLANRIGSVEASFVSTTTLNARITEEQTARTSATSALGTRIDTVTATAGNAASAASIAQTAAADATNKLASARLEFVATSPGGRVSMTFRSDTNGGAGVDIIGDVSISGNLLVAGSVNTAVIAPAAVSNAVSMVQYGMQISNNGATFSTVRKNTQEVSLSYTGGRLRVDVQFECYVSPDFSTGIGTMTARLMLRMSDGSVVPVSREIIVGTSQRNPYTFFVLTQATVGVAAFWIEFALMKTSGSNAVYDGAYIQIVAEENKR